MYDTALLSEISSWSYKVVSNGDQCIDVIILKTTKNGITVECMYNQTKSLVYDEKLKDSVFFYSKHINYIKMRELLITNIPERYEKMAH